MLNDFITALGSWQTIIGALIGAFIGSISQHWLTWKAKRRKEVTSAKILIMDVLSTKGRTKALDNSYSYEDEQKKKYDFICRYLKKKATLSPLFDSSMATVIHYNSKLAAHLVIFRKLYLNIEESITWFEEKVRSAASTGEEIDLSYYGKADIDTIYDGLHLASRHAECINFYLEESVLSKFRYFKKNIMKFKNICSCQNGLEKKCRELINKGD